MTSVKIKTFYSDIKVPLWLSVFEIVKFLVCMAKKALISRKRWKFGEWGGRKVWHTRQRRQRKYFFKIKALSFNASKVQLYFKSPNRTCTPVPLKAAVKCVVSLSKNNTGIQTTLELLTAGLNPGVRRWKTAAARRSVPARCRGHGCGPWAAVDFCCGTEGEPLGPLFLFTLLVIHSFSHAGTGVRQNLKKEGAFIPLHLRLCQL